ncbi:hypothetical protein [Jonesia quinghaiensis]|uniref:hypothetical protein n=1 Tax=Jonesia quinghaiensis TaxID=262806 RepID=UPI0004143F61|nr:hypothetical protein [Jonesia quinghaiensis]
MKKIFWIGTGVALTVLVYTKGRKVVRRYAPEAVAERVGHQAADFAERADAAAHGFIHDFTTAFHSRQDELMAALLADTQPSVDELRARHAARKASPRAEDFPDVDPIEEELGYSF